MPRRPLSVREVDVLIELADGATNPVIAERLGITVSTAKTHVRRLCAALGVSDRHAAVEAGYRAGLLHACPTCRRPRSTPGGPARNDQHQEQQ